MSNNIGIEINGGGNNLVDEGKINIHGGGKGIVSNNSFNNKFTNVEINIKEQNELLTEIRDIINNINDNTINILTKNSFKSESLKQIDEIINKKDNLANIANLTTILTSWITICNPLIPIIQPHLEHLKQFLVG